MVVIIQPIGQEAMYEELTEAYFIVKGKMRSKKAKQYRLIRLGFSKSEASLLAN